MTDPDTPPPGTAAAGPDAPADAPKVPLAAFRRASPHSSRAPVPVTAVLGRDLVLSSIPWSHLSRNVLLQTGIVDQLAGDRARLIASVTSISRFTVTEPPPFPRPAVDLQLGFSRMLAQPAVDLQLGLSRMLAQPAVDLQLGLSRMLASQDLGLLGLHRQLTIPAWGIVSGSSALFRLTDLLRQWQELALFGTGLLRRVAWDAYAAALDARDAVVHGDKARVAVFIGRWLHLKPTPAMVEAVSMALLEEGWDDTVPDDPDPLLGDLRKRTKRTKRNLRPVWETQISHQRIGLLGDPLRTRRGASGAVARPDAPKTLLDVLADPRTPEDLVIARLGHDDRLGPILSMLKADERGVVDAYAGGDGLSWAEAACMAGAAEPAAVGERVRRKLKRLGAEQQRRRDAQMAGM